MKKKILTVLLTAALLLLLIFVMPSFLHNKKNERADNQLVASHIYGLIAGNIEKPVGVTTGLSSDEFLIRVLRQEESTSEKAMEEMMSSYLSAVKKQFGYETSYVISEKTRRFYTAEGIRKIVNPQMDPYDNWYPIFLDTGLKVLVDTQRNQLFEYRWSIFINARIYDSEGKTLGVCGIALSMENWQKMLLSVEKDYRVKINLIDSQGLVQVDTDYSNLKNAYISEALSDNANPESFTYTRKGLNGFRITRWMPTLNWCLVVQGSNFIEAQFTGILIIILISLLIVTSVFIILAGKKKNSRHDLVKSSLPEDSLTGLPNRNYLKESYGELGVFNTTRYKSLCVFDIDHFKIINDDRDGDTIILSVVEFAKEALDERGIMFRWSGDEFVIFLEMEITEAKERLKQFLQKTKEKLDVTVSAGIVKVDLSVSIKINYYRAVQACYIVKERGGNDIGER